VRHAAARSLVLLAALGCAATATAQPEAPPAPPAAPPSAAADSAPPAPRRPDLEIGATVRMRELHVVTAPEGVRVDFPGEPERWTVWRTEEIGLPEELVSGATYFDALIRLSIASTFAFAGEDEVRPPLAPASSAPPDD
jgi:hypothetical protein